MSITLYYKMAKNIKNNKSKPFPCNRNAAILIQRNIAVFRPQISRRMPSILHRHQPAIPAKAGIQGNPAKDGFPLAAGMTAWARRSNVALENTKNNKAKPFPGNFNSAMSYQRKIAVFRPQISRRMPSISILPPGVPHGRKIRKFRLSFGAS
ncbi:MAG: hypothetical protein PHR28_08805 [candidate division Zixibacteria bacterium]|nr:hypothetical protein [candidate division Zixibacteria bacterium]